jgi:hypothetical protein
MRTPSYDHKDGEALIVDLLMQIFHGLFHWEPEVLNMVPGIGYQCLSVSLSVSKSPRCTMRSIVEESQKEEV